MNKHITRKYNGVNHDIYVYSKDFAVNRKNQYFLTNPQATPDEIIKQEKPLSVYSVNIPICTKLLKTNVFSPEVYGVNIDFALNPFDYDMIIVSNFYANIARQMSNINPDYMDRLYSPVTLYSENPQNANHFVSKKIGCIGFRKVCFPRTPRDYVNEIYSGGVPSKTSIKLCIDMYRSQGICYDNDTMSCLYQLDKIFS